MIRSWNHWFPRDLPGSSWVGGSGGQPAKHEIRFALPDGTTMETEIIFAAIGENSAEEVMRGWELTGVYLNEADTLDEVVLDFAIGRVGRYPAVDRSEGFAGPSWSGVWLDFNAPDTEHWIYPRFVEQRDSLGVVRILDELVAPSTGEGAESFGKRLRRLLDERYPGYRCEGYADPAGNARNDSDERSWVAVMQAVTGLPWRLAPTNAPLMRWEAVRSPLKRLVDGRPGFVLSPRCKMLRKDFNSGYRFKRVPGSAGLFADKADKNEYSHPHDGLQYLCLGLGEHHQALGHGREVRGPRQVAAITDDNPQGGWEHDERQAYADD